MCKKTNNSKIRILSDDPSQEDLLGPHGNIAKAIASLIINPDPEQEGIAILLVGERGSGKTTIVNLLENELKSQCHTKKTMVFKFDAWVHQGEVLKRAFLERLIDYCLKNNLIKSQWGSLRKRIFCSSSRVTPFPTTSAFIFLTLMVGSVLALPILEGVENSWWALPVWLEEFKLAWIMLLPFFLLVFIGIIGMKYLIDDTQALNKVTTTHEIPWYLRLAGTSTITSSLTVQEPQPTSIEFQKHYHNLLADLFSNDGQTKSLNKCDNLVFVIDNLDRLQSKQMTESWDELQLFCRPENIPLAKRIWLLLPMNPDASQAEEISKVCQVSFSVPDPVISRWRNYFNLLLGKAMPAFTDDKEKEAVFGILYKLIASWPNPPTPRQILLFVNQLAASFLVWHDEVPLRMQAWFVLLVMSKVNILDILRTTDERNLLQTIPPEIRSQSWPPYGWRGPLATLYYGMPLDAAVQMVLGPIITEAQEGVS